MSNGNKTQLGKILLKQKLVKPDELDPMLTEQRTDHERLASKTLTKGFADEIGVLKALSEQHGVPALNLDEVEIPVANLDLIPRDIALKHLILPVNVTGDTVHLAMANPSDNRVIEEIEFVSGRRVFPHVSLHTHIIAAIDACYAARSEGQSVWRGSKFDPRSAVTGQSEPQPSRDSRGTVIADPGEIPEVDIDVDMNEEEPAEEKPSMPGFSGAAFFPAAGQDTAPLEEDSLLRPEAGRPLVSASPTGLTILVVDDEDDIRLLISRVLSDKGYRVVTAARGLEAIHKVQGESPDMIILDAMLPEVHGFDICKKIKNSSKYGHIPVIMISAIYRGWRYAKDLKESYGVDDFVEKPFKITDLLQKVERLFRAAASETQVTSEDLSQEAERILQTGIEAYRKGDIDEAVELLRKGIAIDPLAFKLHYHLALLLGRQGLGYQAIRSLENALELAPDFFPALKNLAVLYQKAGFKNKAIETWERALGHCPDEETREGIKRHLVSLL